MNYSETIEYLFNSLPMFQRDGKAAFKKDLDNTLRLCGHIGNPQEKFRSIHIAGTNGKGSTAHLLASIFQEAGYKTALYTSPHLKDFRERIKINGAMISEQTVIEFVESYRKGFENIQPSFFEWTVALAFYEFAAHKVDIAIIETGMGGRLDSTNVITPELSIITNISLDHTQYLGTSLEKIAGEKAGIIKEDTPVLIGEKGINEKLFSDRAKELNSSIFFAEDYDVPKDLESELKGTYQYNNIRTVYAAWKILVEQDWKLKKEHLYLGCKKVIKNTGLRGRWEILDKKPLTITDTGHNEAGIQQIVKQISKLKFDNLHIVLGVVSDKDLTSILKYLPKNASYYFCAADIPRALAASKLKESAKYFSLIGEDYSSVEQAIFAAKHAASQQDVIFIGGSTFVVAEAI